MTGQPKCELCGEPMPVGEEMFKYHGFSCNCPKPPLERETMTDYKTVPVEPTKLMVEAGFLAAQDWYESSIPGESERQIYKAMLAAAPEPKLRTVEETENVS